MADRIDQIEEHAVNACLSHNPVSGETGIHTHELHKLLISELRWLRAEVERLRGFRMLPDEEEPKC